MPAPALIVETSLGRHRKVARFRVGPENYGA